MDEIKVIFSFALGVGVGVLASNVFFKKKYAEISDREIQEVKSAYQNKFGMPTKDEEPANDVNIYEDTSSINYDKITEKIDAQKKEVMDRVLASEHPEEDPSEDIFEISEEEYSETELSYDKDVLHYFVDDGVIFDPGENKVCEYSVLGDKNITLVANSVDTYSLYFRDDKFGKDYEVIKIAGAYNEGV